MGMYQYTLRAGTKTVNDIEIASYEYAYKLGWEWYPGQTRGRIGRKIAAFDAQAANAQYKNRHVKHAIHGSLKEIKEGESRSVHYFENGLPDQLCEGISSNRYPVVGYLVKRNGRFRFEQPATAMAA